MIRRGWGIDGVPPEVAGYLEAGVERDRRGMFISAGDGCAAWRGFLAAGLNMAPV